MAYISPDSHFYTVSSFINLNQPEKFLVKKNTKNNLTKTFVNYNNILFVIAVHIQST